MAEIAPSFLPLIEAINSFNFRDQLFNFPDSNVSYDIIHVHKSGQKLWRKISEKSDIYSKTALYSPTSIQITLWGIVFLLDAKYFPHILEILYGKSPQDDIPPLVPCVRTMGRIVPNFASKQLLYFRYADRAKEKLKGKLSTDRPTRLNAYFGFDVLNLDLPNIIEESLADFKDPEFKMYVMNEIRERMSLVPNFNLFFINAYYFKPIFAVPFFASQTYVQKFKVKSKVESSSSSRSSTLKEKTWNVRVLHSCQKVKYRKLESAKVIALEVDKRLRYYCSMWIILPDSKTGEDDYENLKKAISTFYPNDEGAFDKQTLFSEFHKTMTDEWVDISLPKLKFTEKIEDLREFFQELGVQYIFNKDINPFSKFENRLENICADVMFQILCIDIDDIPDDVVPADMSPFKKAKFEREEPPKKRIAFEALHPFFFAIVDANHVKLQGIVANQKGMESESEGFQSTDTFYGVPRIPTDSEQQQQISTISRDATMQSIASITDEVASTSLRRDSIPDDQGAVGGEALDDIAFFSRAGEDSNSDDKIVSPTEDTYFDDIGSSSGSMTDDKVVRLAESESFSGLSGSSDEMLSIIVEHPKEDESMD